MRWRYSGTCAALFWPAQHALYHSAWSKTVDTIRWRTGRRINPRFQRQWELIVACFCSFFDPKAEEDTETWAKLKLIVAWRPVNTGASEVFAIYGGKIPRTPLSCSLYFRITTPRFQKASDNLTLLGIFPTSWIFTFYLSTRNTLHLTVTSIFIVLSSNSSEHIKHHRIDGL